MSLNFWLIFAGMATCFVSAVRFFVMARKAGMDHQRSKELDAYEKHLRELQAAGDARDAAGGSVPNDPYDRDNRKG